MSGALSPLLNLDSFRQKPASVNQMQPQPLHHLPELLLHTEHVYIIMKLYRKPGAVAERPVELLIPPSGDGVYKFQAWGDRASICSSI